MSANQTSLDVVEIARNNRKRIYTPINFYQTRLIRLEGDNGDPASPLVCTLHVADILHPKFEGLGPPSELSTGQGHIAEYDALSYTWGTNGFTQILACNDVELPITENLFQALKVLRLHQHRYLWVDAICINQDDHVEKADQIWNMLLIYQKAKTVIAWLGAAPDSIAEVINAANLVARERFCIDEIDPERLIAGMTDIYNRDWFQRIWVQQEIFASRKLMIQCGEYGFEWPELLSEPELLLKCGLSEDSIEPVVQLHQVRQRCFEKFRIRSGKNLEIVNTLWNTGQLKAAEQRNLIYGKVGMTDFPAKSMPISECMAVRCLEDPFIPIDVTASIDSVLCAVSWNLIMEFGIIITATYEIHDNSAKCGLSQLLPSWAVDWRVTAKAFMSKDVNYLRRLGEFRSTTKMGGLESGREMYMKDNDGDIQSYKTLIVRGTGQHHFYSEGRLICLKPHKEGQPHEPIWTLGFDVEPTDLIVHLEHTIFAFHHFMFTLIPLLDSGSCDQSATIRSNSWHAWT